MYLSSLITFCPELRYIIGLTDFFGMHTKSLNKSNFPIQCTYQVIQMSNFPIMFMLTMLANHRLRRTPRQNIDKDWVETTAVPF